jgi:hypothetical protein
MPNNFCISRVIKFLIVAFLLSSCSSRNENDKIVIALVTKSLQMSNENLTNQNNYIYDAFAESVKDPQTMERAMLWRTKAHKVREETNLLLKILQDEKLVLSDSVMLNTLKEKVKSFNEKLKNIDEEIEYKFERLLNESSVFNSVSVDDKMSMLNSNRLSADQSKALVAQQIYYARITENAIIDYCYSEVRAHIATHDYPKLLVWQNYTHLKKGDKLEIKAGIGAFSILANQVIKVDNKIIKINENGISEMSFIANGKVGKYFKTITIQFTNPDDNVENLEKRIEYTIDQ